MPDDTLSPQNAESQTSPQPLPEAENYRIKLIIIGSLLFVAIGSFIFPAWWWYFLFEGGFASNEIWYWGISYICRVFLLPLLVICTFLYLEPILLKQESIGLLVKKWSNRVESFVSKRDRYIVLFLIAVLAVSLITLDVRSKSSRLGYTTRLPSRQNITEVPLERPSRFIFLSEKVITSLYKQREGDLAIAKVTEEVQASKNLKGEVKLAEVLKTDAEKSEAEKKITEYQATRKSPEQQLKDLVGFLYKGGAIPVYGQSRSVKSVSEETSRSSVEKSENQKLEDALKFLERYDLSVDQEKLERLRSRLLAREIQNLESSLREVQGQILVIGNWLISFKDDSYIFSRSFIEKVLDSPICEFKLPKGTIIPESKSIINNVMSSDKNRVIKLGIFGSVTSGVTGGSKKVLLDPIAVYLP
jgi:hypothetical protein